MRARRHHREQIGNAPEATCPETLGGVYEHGAVLLVQSVLAHFDDVVGSDSEQVCIERGVMQPAEGDAIRDCWDAKRFRVGQDVCRFEELVPP